MTFLVASVTENLFFLEYERGLLSKLHKETNHPRIFQILVASWLVGFLLFQTLYLGIKSLLKNAKFY